MRTDARELLRHLLEPIDRRPGSEGNEAAVDYAAAMLKVLGWPVSTPSFPVVTWRGEPGQVTCGDVRVVAHPSWYGLGVDAAGPLDAADSADQLRDLVAARRTVGAVVLLHGPLTSQALTPAGYPFYSVPGHEELRDLLATSGAVAILATPPSVTDPLAPIGPFIEDGTFPLPPLDVTGLACQALLRSVGQHVSLYAQAVRWPARASNVVAVNRESEPGRVLLTAHIDTKPGTPGALGNAAGVAVLLRVGELLAVTSTPVVLVLFNGEDHFAAPGELDWMARLRAAGQDLDTFSVMVNIDARARSATSWNGLATTCPAASSSTWLP